MNDKMKNRMIAEIEIRIRRAKKRRCLVDAGIAPISFDKVQPRLVRVRNQLVIIDADAAELYGVSLRHLNEQVFRNIERFPRRFMFRLTPREFTVLKSQASVPGLRRRRKPPLAFTEVGLYMVATVLRGGRAAGPVISMVETLALSREMKFLQSTALQSLAFQSPFHVDRRVSDASCTLFGEVLGALGVPTQNFIGARNYALFEESAQAFREKFCQNPQLASRAKPDAD